MVEVVPFQYFCIFDPTILHLTRNTGRARLSLYFLQPQETFPALGISNIRQKSVARLPQKDAMLSFKLLSPMDEIQAQLRKQPVKVGDILQIEFDLREDPETGGPLMGYKLRFAKKERFEEPWSKLTVGPIPDFARWVVNAPKSDFVVMNMEAMNFFILYGRLPKMLRFPQFSCEICCGEYDMNYVGAFQCGHTMCYTCISNHRNTSDVCHICKTTIQDLVLIRQRDGLCPIDGCEHKERAFFFSPCGCMIHHWKRPSGLYMQFCPYPECGELIEQMQSLYLG